MSKLLEALGLAPTPARLAAAAGTQTMDDAAIGVAKPVVMPALPRRDPRLAVPPAATLPNSALADPGTLESAVKSLVTNELGAPLRFVPPLSSLTTPGTQVLQVSVAASPSFLPAGPMPLRLTIKAKAELQATDAIELFVGDDVGAAVQAELTRKGTGEYSFSISWAELGKLGTHPLQVSVKADAEHEEDGPVPMSVTVRKRKGEIKLLGTIAPRTVESEKKQQIEWLKDIKSQLPKLVQKNDPDAELAFAPSLEKLQCVAGAHDFKVKQLATATHTESEEETISVVLYMSKEEAVIAFGDWLKTESVKLQPGQLLKLKTAGIKDAYTFRSHPISAACAGKKDVADQLLRLAGAGHDGKDKIWEILGFPQLKGGTNWILVGQEAKAGDHKFHLSISFGSIALPAAKLEGSAQAIFDLLFMKPIAKARVHATLELGGAGDGNPHLFLGGVDGAGTEWSVKIAGMKKSQFNRATGEQREIQIAIMQAKLDEWQQSMIVTIASKLAELGNLKLRT